MAYKKNQHFVPKVHLKFFANDSENRQINIWLHKKDRVVEGASIKDQCSKAYYYGRDLKIENFLNSPEALFGRIVDRVVKFQNIGEDDLFGLLFLWLLQNIRAERSITENLLMMSAMRDKISSGQEENEELQKWLGPSFTAPEAMQMMLESAKEYFDAISDLRCVLLINHTDTEFVLSDCPAVSSNKLVLKRYMNYRNWGLSSAGLYIYMPLTPKYGFFAFDRHVYELISRNGNSCNLVKADVIALNQLVYLFCNDLIVLPPSCEASAIIESLKSVKSAKPESTLRVNVAVEDEEQSIEGSRRFSVATDEEFASSARSGLIHVESVPPIVPYHFPKLRIRQNPKYIDTKSGAGLKRFGSTHPF